MKASTTFASCFIAAVAQVPAADNLALQKSAPQRVAPPAVVQTPAIKGGERQSVADRNLGLRKRNIPFPRPSQRGTMAMNVQRPIRYDKTRSAPTQLPQVRKVNPTANNLRSNSNRESYFEALKRYPKERHDRSWWHRHCQTIVYINTGYYYLNAGYWYPAYGYNPAYDSYYYDGPIYTYGNLLPDQVIANVQRALKEAGYYAGPITGSIGTGTRAALGYFQRDYGLIITEGIDEPTVAALGLI